MPQANPQNAGKPIIVHVDGVGNVEFPAGTSMDEVSRIIETEILPTQTSKPASAPSPMAVSPDTKIPKPEDLGLLPKPANWSDALPASLQLPPEPESAGFLGGVWKDLQSTGTGIMKAAKGAATGDFGPFDEPGLEEEIYEPLQPVGDAEKVGAAASQIGQFFLPAGMVNRGIKAVRAATGGSKAATIGATVGAEGLSNAFVAGLQTGGDLEAAAITGAVSGGVRGALGARGVLRETPDVVSKAAEFDVPLLKAEQTGSKIAGIMKQLVESAATGAPRLAQFTLDRNQKLGKIANELIDVADAMPPAEAGEFLQRALKRALKQTRGRKEKTIKAIVKSGTPDTIIDTLLRAGSETRLTNLEKLLHREKMDQVRAALWQRITSTDEAYPGLVTSDRGLFLGDRLKKILDRLSPEAKRALFGDEQLIAKINRFASLAGDLAKGVTKNLPEKASGEIGPMAGQLGARALTFGGIIQGSRAVTQQDTGGSVMLNLGMGTVLAISPAMLAKAMTRPGVVDDMTKALTADPATKAGQQIAARLAAFFSKEVAAEDPAWMPNQSLGSGLSYSLPSEPEPIPPRR